MVQAARSGVQNIAEGSLASATSKKTELKLTQVARASLEELLLDYEDYLRHNQLEQLKSSHPILVRTIQEFRMWLAGELKRKSFNCQSVLVSGSPKLITPWLVANGVLSLLNLATYLLEKQVETLAREFTIHGGFSEKMYKVRSEYRNRKK